MFCVKLKGSKDPLISGCELRIAESSPPQPSALWGEGEGVGEKYQ